MLWFLIFGGFFVTWISIGAFLIWLFYTWKEDSFDSSEWYIVRRAVIVIILGIVAFSIGEFGRKKVENLSYDEVVQTGYWEMVSDTDDGQISIEYSDELFEKVYSFYCRLDDDSIERIEIDADATTIYEKDNCTPHIVEYTTYTKNKMNSTLKKFLLSGDVTKKNYEIYIPKGTASKTFRY